MFFLLQMKKFCFQVVCFDIILFEPGGADFASFVFLSVTSPIKTPGLSNFVILHFYLFYIFFVSFTAISCLDPE